MADFVALTVSDVRRETPACVSIAFDVSAQPAFANFKAGQYLNLKLAIDGTEVRRSYSISSAPRAGEVRVAVKAVEGGFASVYLQSVKVGDVLEASAPEGNFLAAIDGTPKHHVFFGAGSGITPLRSLVADVLARDPEGKATLFFGNTGAQHTIFKADLEAWAAHEDRFHLQHVWTDGSLAPRYSGRIDFSKATELLSELDQDGLQREFYLCGPAGMIGAVKEALQDQGVADANIHVEYFAAPVEDRGESTGTPAAAPVAIPEGGAAKVTVVLDDEEVILDLDPDGEVILDAALDAGMDAPFSCKGGVCTTCRAKVLEGETRMDNNYALTDGEVAEGYILTCQAHPTTASVKVSWDEP